MTQLYIYNR